MPARRRTPLRAPSLHPVQPGAQAHPRFVHALVLRGVCLMRRAEIDYLFGDCADAGRLNPGPWRRFVAASGVDPATLAPGGRALLSAYSGRLVGADPGARAAAARAWSTWENGMFGWRPADEAPAYAAAKQLLPGTPHRVLSWDGQRWSLPGTDSTPEAAAAAAALAESLKHLPPPASPSCDTGSAVVARAASVAASVAANVTAAAREGLGKLTTGADRTGWVPAQNMLTAHYSAANGFLGDSALLDGMAGLRAAGVVGRAVQGGADSICPPRTAMALHGAWPELEVRVVLEAGHSMYDQGITSELVKATDAFRERRAEVARPMAGLLTHSDTQKG